MSIKKANQLGMNPSTASARLVKDLLWYFIEETGRNVCCKCGQPMTRETFSIEHVIPWLDSDDPVGLFFSKDNIAFSHLKCNVSDRRSMQVTFPCGTSACYSRGCRCAACKKARAELKAASYSKEKRHSQYVARGT